MKVRSNRNRTQNLIVIDNSVISAFYEIGRFELLHDILKLLNLQPVIPNTVEKAIIFDQPLSVITHGLPSTQKWIQILPVKGYEKYLRSLHSGEAGVIALARQTQAIAALDDLRARKIARAEDVRITGTLGLIKVGYELCPIEDKAELAAIIDSLRSIWFRMTEDIENEILGTEKM